MIEANPRASRTVPFVSKAVGVPLAKLACRIMLGERIADMGLPQERQGLGYGEHISVKEAVLAVRPLRELRRRARPGDALDRRGDGRRPRLPDRVRQGPGRRRRAAAEQGTAFITVTDEDKAGGRRHRPVAPRRRLSDRRHARHGRGDRTHGRAGRAAEQDRRGLARTSSTGSNAATSTSSSTPRPAFGARTDGYEIRRAAVTHGVPCLTTLSAGYVGSAGDLPRGSTASPRCCACRSCTAPAARPARREQRGRGGGRRARHAWPAAARTPSPGRRRPPRPATAPGSRDGCRLRQAPLGRLGVIRRCARWASTA